MYTCISQYIKGHDCIKTETRAPHHTDKYETHLFSSHILVFIVISNSKNYEGNADDESCDLMLKTTRDKLRARDLEYHEIEKEKKNTLSKLTEAEKNGVRLKRHLKEQKNDFLRSVKYKPAEFNGLDTSDHIHI